MNASPRPPQARSEALQGARQMPGDTLQLQRCTRCRHWQYPPRELCAHCLGEHLDWQIVADNCGLLIATVDLQHSLLPFFQQRLPWRIASVQLHCGPIAIVHIPSDEDATSRELAVYTMTSAGEAPFLIGVAAGDDAAARAHRAAHSLGLLEDRHDD